MKYLLNIVCVLLLILAGCDSDALTVPDRSDLDVAAKQAPIGFVGSVIDYDLPESPEGIAFDRRGNLYVGVRDGLTSRIDRLTPDGTLSVFATLPDHLPGAFGVLGLIVSPNGVVYAAHTTGSPATSGVYRIPRGGTPERMPGSEGMTLPNSLAFDSIGNLYATDSFGPASVFLPGGGCTAPTQCGSIWKYEPGGSFAQWLVHPFFDSMELPGAPIPVPGANGIAYFESDTVSPTLYVANTSMALISSIPLNPDGSPGPVGFHAAGFELATVDGIAVDTHGNVYGVMAASGAEETGAPPVPAVTRVYPDGTVEAIVAFAVETPFDSPTSLAFSSGPRSRKSVFVVNAALYGPLPNNVGPGVVEVNVGVPGFQTR